MSKRWELAKRLRGAAKECGVEAREPYYLFESYDDVPEGWPKIGEQWERDPTGWLCEECANRWCRLAAETGCDRIVTVADVAKAGMCISGVQEFSDRYFGGAKSVQLSRITALLSDPLLPRGDRQDLEEAIGHLVGEPNRVYDRQRDTSQGCELCGCVLEFTPTAECIEGELEHFATVERFDAHDLCILAECVDSDWAEDCDEMGLFELGERALANHYVTASKERQRRAFSWVKLAGAWGEMRNLWREEAA